MFLDSQKYFVPFKKDKMVQSSPVPYLISFLILFIIALGVLTWMLGNFYKAHQCSINPNIWCGDTWTCTNLCPTENGETVGPTNLPVNSCFGASGPSGPTGLASCLYGPQSFQASVCFSAATGSDPDQLLCTCPSTLNQEVANCFGGCGINLSSVQSSLCCCCGPNCKSNTEGCNGTCPPT